MPGQMLPGTNNFTSGQFARELPRQVPGMTMPSESMPTNPQRQYQSASGSPPPVQVPRPANAQLGSSTPMSTPAPMTPEQVARIPPDAAILENLANQNPDAGPPVQTPVDQIDRRTGRPLFGKAPSLAESLAQKAQLGQLTSADIAAAVNSGDEMLIEAVTRAAAGGGWSYNPRPARPPADPGFVPPPMASWWDRSGAGPGMGATPPQAENFMAPPPPADSGVAYPTPPRKPYRVFTSPAAGGVYTG